MAKNDHDESYQGYDITIYTHDNDTCTVDVKYPCGELIAGWVDIEDFEKARSLARTYIYALGDYSEKKPHCDNEYCTGE